MDPFDEFEFKPITEGLGFHNKKPQNAPIQNLNSVEFQIPDRESIDIQTPLPRKNEKKEPQLPKVSPSSSTVDEILKTLNEKKNLDFLQPQPLQDKKRTTTTESYFDLSAALLDSMLVIAGYLASLIVLLMVTKTDLFFNLMNPDEDKLIFIGLGILFAFISWSYLILNRIFMGQTPGEWVFDQRLGAETEVGTTMYSIKVFARSTIVILTGFILFPVLSMIFRSDLLGSLLNQKLVKKV